MQKRDSLTLDQDGQPIDDVTDVPAQVPQTKAVQVVKAPRPPAERKTAKQIAAQARLLQRVVHEVMQEDVHYGIIPGTPKPTLFKAGAEKLLSTFNVAVTPQEFDQSGEDDVTYLVHCAGHHQVTGIHLGTGVGWASTNEEKYKWRRAVCDEEYEDTDEDRRRIKYQKYRGEVERVKQIRTEPADLANTVLKMAKKRAQIDLTLTATGASDVFTQDLDEDGNLVQRNGSPENRRSSQPARSAPRGPTGSGKLATDKQVAFIKSKLESSQKTLAALCEAMKVEGIEKLTMDQVNDTLAWIES
jgi:hypothetical protein